MASSSQHIEKKVSNETSQIVPLPAPLAYTRPNDLFTGRICTLADGEEIERALAMAYRIEDVKAVKEILEKHNIGVNATTHHVGLQQSGTLLWVAVYWKKSRMVKFLLNEPSLHISREEGIKALYSALNVNSESLFVSHNFKRANYEIAYDLIKAGVDINHVEYSEGYEITLLMRAWLLRNQEIANRLILWGADIALSERCYNKNKSLKESKGKCKTAVKPGEVSKRTRMAFLGVGERYYSNLASQQHLEASVEQLTEDEPKMRCQISSSKYLIELLSNAKNLGMGIEELCCSRQLSKTIGSNIASFLVERNNLAIRAFNATRDRARQLLPEPAMPPERQIPRALLFTGNVANLPKPVVDEIAWQQWANSYGNNENFPNRQKPGYGPGAMVPYQPNPYKP